VSIDELISWMIDCLTWLHRLYVLGSSENVYRPSQIWNWVASARFASTGKFGRVKGVPGALRL
jgi:hypothetical protein